MSNITAIVSEDGEVISMSDFGSEKEFVFKVLNGLEFETVKDFFIKKTIIDAVRDRHKTSNGSNGVPVVELLNLFKWQDLEPYILELEQKRFIKRQQGINSILFFIPKTVKR
jgi:hypothetical protein